jgi:very-short-patch-repair endonuclease
VAPDLTDRARDLRVHQSKVEAKLWSHLRDRRLGEWKWRRQVPRGAFIVDFYCAEAGLVVELDGGLHLDPEAAAYDARRTAHLQAGGLKVLRFMNDEVWSHDHGVCEVILAACGGTAPHPALRADLSPQAGRGEL